MFSLHFGLEQFKVLNKNIVLLFLVLKRFVLNKELQNL